MKIARNRSFPPHAGVLAVWSSQSKVPPMPDTNIERVLIIGASLAGLRVGEGLRRHGYEANITVVGAEPHLPYDRPPLSKHFLSGDTTKSESL